MPCPKCRYENPPDAAACGLCGELLRPPAGFPPPASFGAAGPAAPPQEFLFSAPAPRPAPAFPAAPPAPPEPRWRAALRNPWTAIAAGLIAFPVAKLLWIPNYVFNFLTTLVHECGHALFAWAVGRPSIPSVSIAGGGLTGWADEPALVLQLGWMALLGWGVYAWRTHRFRRNALIAVAVAYPFLSFTRFNAVLPPAGGIALEIGGAAACFFTVLYVDLQRPFERPLYALWGWWMLLNRAWETLLMIKSRGYWDAQAIIQSGLAAGLTSDLKVLEMQLGVSPQVILWAVLIACGAALPAAWGAAHVVRLWNAPGQGVRL